MPAKPRKAPKPTVLRDFFGSLDDKTKGLLLLTLNLESNSELPRILVGRLRNDHA
jgi:hypothetical protein